MMTKWSQISIMIIIIIVSLLWRLGLVGVRLLRVVLHPTGAWKSVLAIIIIRAWCMSTPSTFINSCPCDLRTSYIEQHLFLAGTIIQPTYVIKCVTKKSNIVKKRERFYGNNKTTTGRVKKICNGMERLIDPHPILEELPLQKRTITTLKAFWWAIWMLAKAV